MPRLLYVEEITYNFSPYVLVDPRLGGSHSKSESFMFCVSVSQERHYFGRLGVILDAIYLSSHTMFNGGGDARCLLKRYW